MFFSIYPTKDNTITDATVNGSAKTGSNQGQSEVLDLFVLPQASSSATYGKSRILMQFDIASLSSSISEGLIPSSSVQFKLLLKNAAHSETLPESFDISVYPVTTAWDEGSGLSNFDEDLKSAGSSNWINAKSIQSWSEPGGDFSTTLSSSQHYDTGEADLNVDISNIVYAWLTGGIANNGLMIKMPTVYESGSNELYVKKFFSRHSHVPERFPSIQCLWDSDVYQDDRNNMKYLVDGNLFFYNKVNGILTDLPYSLFVDIFDGNNTFYGTLSASRMEVGIYKSNALNLTLPNSPFRDQWRDNQINNTIYYTDRFSAYYGTGSNSIRSSDVVVTLPNLKPVYRQGEITFVKVFAREKDYKPAIRRSGSVEPSPICFKDSYYEISNAETEEVIVPFSTGSVKFSKLSYDKEGNYFKFNMASLPIYGSYKIKILVNHSGEKTIFDNDWVFKVEQ